jgi:diadenosine tetraphosphate (Ap4A) HIT family hydrolase
MQEQDCLYCMFARGEIKFQKIHENKDHLAFLSPSPRTDGATVVLPRKHYSGNPLWLPKGVSGSLREFSVEVGKILARAYDDVSYVGFAVEGKQVDHLHEKLYPLHTTRDPKNPSVDFTPVPSESHNYENKYPGYFSTNSGPIAASQKLYHDSNHIRNWSPKNLKVPGKGTFQLPFWIYEFLEDSSINDTSNVLLHAIFKKLYAESAPCTQHEIDMLIEVNR